MNFQNLFHNKKPDDQQQRKVEDDRRQNTVPVAEEKRKQEDRRNLVRDNSKIMETYSKIPIFTKLSREQLLKMLRICSKTKYSAMHYLYHVGDESKTLHILLKGRLKIMLRTGEVWKTLTPYESVGEMGFFTGQKRSADVIADTECLLLQLNKNEVTNLFAQDKDLHIQFLENIVVILTEKLLSDHDEMGELYNRIRSIDLI